MARRNIYSVGQINRYIKNMFAQDFMMRRVSVSGEVSNCKYHASGHIFFSLKDETGVLAAVMFRSDVKSGLAFPMKDGDEVVASGSIRVFERDGRYQLYALKIEPAGSGILHQRFEALKKELEEMGMFDAAYKRPIPRFPKTVGIVTAPTGAAIRDIVNIASRRNPYVQLVLCPAQVQGSGAAESIVRGIRALEAYGADVLIIGRGGGSIEDLWPFNERIVAEAVFDCSIPVISAVGHETDTTITDYVADLRAPTPSAAAELAVCDIRAVLAQLVSMQDTLTRSMREHIRRAAEYRRHLALRLESVSPGEKLRHNRERTKSCARTLQTQMERLCADYRYRVSGYRKQLPAAIRQRTADGRMTAALYEMKLSAAMESSLHEARNRLEKYGIRLEAQSPLKRLGGGYAYLTDDEQQAILSAAQLQKGDAIRGVLPDGSFQAEVRRVWMRESE